MRPWTLTCLLRLKPGHQPGLLQIPSYAVTPAHLINRGQPRRSKPRPGDTVHLDQFWASESARLQKTGEGILSDKET